MATLTVDIRIDALLAARQELDVIGIVLAIAATFFCTADCRNVLSPGKSDI